MIKDYTKFMKWAVISFLSRSTQDDCKDKIHIAGLFPSPTVAQDSFIPYLPNKEVKRYLIHVDDLEEFERFYNFINDLKEEHNSKWIYHLEEGHFSVDQERKFRLILNIWTN